jgi:L-fucose isomerase-like protein
MKQKLTFGLIVGNRNFFPAYLCESGRATLIKVMEQEGIEAVTLSPQDTTYGSVESLHDAEKCAELFRAHRDEIDGIIVTLPNFGDERAVANSLRFAHLNVPVLIHAYPDAVGKMSVTERRDGFCGKMSVCNNLNQYGIPFSLTTLHTVDPESENFRRDLRRFAAVCRVVRGMRHARFGMLGARPAAFNTVRFSEKLFEKAGMSVETLDLSEVFGRIAALPDDDGRVLRKVDNVRNYGKTVNVTPKSILKVAKLGVVIDEWISANHYDGTALQCWTSMEEYFGVVPCVLMSMLSDNLMPSACETDIAGAAAMYALALATGRPSALVDWNNNYENDPDKGIVFHCSNLPRSVMVEDIMTITHHGSLEDGVDKGRSWGAVFGRIKADPFTYLRITTDDFQGKIRAYVGEGTFTNDPVDTFGGYGVVQVPNFQELLQYICRHNYEHHVAVSMTQIADAVYEALTVYLGWEAYYHRG